METEIQPKTVSPTKSSTHLTQIQGEVDSVVLCARGERWALPPSFRPVNRMDGRVCLLRILGVTVVTELALGRRKGLLNAFKECFSISLAEETTQAGYSVLVRDGCCIPAWQCPHRSHSSLSLKPGPLFVVRLSFSFMSAFLNLYNSTKNLPNWGCKDIFSTHPLKSS